MTRFFISKPTSDKGEIIALSKEELEEMIGFVYTDETTPDESFQLPKPYNLEENHDIVRRSEISSQFNILKNPEEFLALHYDEKTGWGCFAKQPIPEKTAIISYAGIALNANSLRENDDYLHAVALPYNNYSDLMRENMMKYMGFISSQRKGNLSRFFQHLPKKRGEISGFDDIAWENLRSVIAFDEEREIPMVFLVTSCFIPKGHPIGFDYGSDHFAAKHITPYYFTLRGHPFSPQVLPKLISLNKRWHAILVSLKGSDKPAERETAQSYQFFSYQDLCDLACVDTTYNTRVKPLLVSIKR